MAERHDEPRRQRSARDDAAVGSIEQHIEQAYGLPQGSVQINNPGGSDARSDKKIESLRSDYDNK